MAMIQRCDRCGVIVGQGIEGFGLKLGFKDNGFDACTDCMEIVEKTILFDLGFGKDVKIDDKFDLYKPVAEKAVKSYKEQYEVEEPKTVEIDGTEDE